MRHPYKALFLITWSEDIEWPFIDYLRRQGIHCDVVGSRFPKSYNSVFQKVTTYWPRYLYIGIKAFLKRKDYDIVMGWQQVGGLAYGFFKRISGSLYPKLVIMKFTYPTRKNPLIRQFRFSFVRFVLKSADALWCHSSREVETRRIMFDLPKSKVKTVPMVLTDISDYATAMPISSSEGSYILSVGNERDYGLLSRVAEIIHYPFKIVCQPYNVKNIAFPGHVEVIHAYGETVMRLFQNARLVVIPIKDPTRPGGEGVMLESFSFGKAVVITQTVTSVDYIENGRNGFLVDPGDIDGFAASIRYLLDNPRERKAMGRRNRRLFLSTFCAEAIVKKIYDEILCLLNE